MDTLPHQAKNVCAIKIQNDMQDIYQVLSSSSAVSVRVRVVPLYSQYICSDISYTLQGLVMVLQDYLCV